MDFCPATSRPLRLGSTCVGGPGAAIDPRLEALMGTYNTHREGLLRLAAKFLGCRARAEDVVQDAFVKMLESDLSSIEPARYMFRVVRNLAIDRLRRQRLERNHGVETELDEQPRFEMSPERVLAGRESLSQLVGALNELPNRMRIVFNLSQIQGYTQRDVAKVIGTSPTMVNFLLRDTLSHCRARLGEL
ncbi:MULTISPECIES: sigma-70 family RNA polymerase sigma factor [unclassified Pseudomonas]|uniref:sigma-70 family RNA polymerase sigma factor n=1 Tax=unclassified Pseudomonas TaxID=196821 RepID=UPI0025D2617F|nr:MULTISPECIES: sigma-70 family RNA polymerase sigma factor [unclassified Pseudomonas]